jgi:hypothetical protein
MIPSLSSSDRTAQPDPTSVPARPKAGALPARPDRISTDGSASLQMALDRQPSIRPEVVERARALAADPSYPPPAVITSVATQIAGAPDLSEDLS